MSEQLPCRACHHPRPRDGSGGQASVITSRQALDASAASCLVCGVLSRGLSGWLAARRGSGGVVSGGGDAAATIGTATEPDPEWLRIDLNRATARPSLEIHIFSSGTALSLYSPQETSAPTALLPDLPPGRDIPGSTASPASYAWAREKLLRCEAQHQSCRLARSSALRTHGRPRRLLDVSEEPHDTIYLREVTSDDDEEYAALSHCWGAAPFLQTRTANLAQHLSPGGIPLAALPRTLREAVDAARGLGLRRLWIDSLCIVQDDARDWRAECARMAAVYRGARLVLCASAAAGAHDGLFSDAAGSPPYAPHVEDIIASGPEGQHGEAASAGGGGRVAFRRAYAHMPSSLQRQLQAAPSFPTLARGWIYQERLLAARVLHYGPHELYWECLASSSCQCRDDTTQEPPSTKAEFTPAHWQSLTPDQLTASWHRLVETYTALRLTLARDVFPALSGVARTFHGVARGTYLAGLWERSLVADLLWHAHPPAELPPRPWTWRAPSWSWAATSSPVAYIDTPQLESLCQVEDAKVCLAGDDEMGELEAGGHLVLRGWWVAAAAVSFRPPPDGRPEKYTAWNMLQLEMLRTQVANVWADYNCHLEEDLPPVVLCFLLGRCVPSGALVMLMLKKLPADGVAENDVYQRIGIIQISKPPSSQGTFENWREVFPLEQVVVKII